ncbi:MAG: hypothetical protein U0271_19085 [Polyangiaceae bacterium]
MWLGAFLFTEAVEAPFYAFVLKRVDPPLLGWERWVVALGASAITHPIVWFVLPPIGRALGYWGYVAVAETFAVTVEAVYFYVFKTPRAFLVSLLGNAASAGLGILIRYLFERFLTPGSAPF